MDFVNKDGMIDFKEIFSILGRRKWLIILPFILVTAIVFGLSFLLEKRYESSTMVVIDETLYLSQELQQFVPGQDPGGYAAVRRRQDKLISIRNEIISTGYLSRLINELGLYQDEDIIKEAQKMNITLPEVSVQNLVYRILIEDLRENIRVAFNGQNIVEITTESNDPELSMNFATRLAEIFKDEQLKRELSGVRGALDFTDEQLAIYQKNLSDAEGRKTEFEAEYLQNQLDESVTADTNIRAIMADIDNIELVIDENIRNQTRVRKALNKYKKSELKLNHGDKYSNLKNEIFDNSGRVADFMSKYIWSDPKVLNANLAINRKLREVDDLIVLAVDEQFSEAPDEDNSSLKEFFSLQFQEMVLRQKLNDFEVSLSILRDRIAREPEYEIQLSNLTNDVQSARDIYETFKNQLTGSEISQSLMRGGAESRYRVMEPASMPLEPVKPDRLKLSLMGMVLGLIIGGAAAILAELFDHSFRKIEDVEEILKAPVLASIPNIPSIRGKIKAG
ncbi:MAG: Wzz/FepE/Etk N-terminal domain-containing protein [candidate division Zixibacteria bacterium]